MPHKRNLPDLEPLLNTQQNQLGVVVSEGSNIDSKALAILAVNVALLIFIAQADLTLDSWWMYGLLLGPLGLSLIFDGLSVQPKPYIGASINLDDHPEYLRMDRVSLVLQLLADTKNAITYNRKINAERWRYCLSSIALTAFGPVMLFVILYI